MAKNYTFELRWTCPSCGAKNLGRFTSCQQCHAPLPADVEYEDVDEQTAPEVTDPALLKLAYGGANWVCEYCGGQVRNARGECAVCQAPRGAPAGPVLPKPSNSPAPTQGKALQGCFVLLLFSCCLGICLPKTKDSPPPAPKIVTPAPPAFTWVEAEVSDVSWQLSEQRLVQVLRHDRGWELPSAALKSKCSRKVAVTENCDPYQCGETTETYDCRPHDCNPYQVTNRCRPHDCHPHTVQVKTGSTSCHCRPGNCVNQRNGFKKCSEVCDSCPVYGTRTEYDTCYDTCRETKYRTCFDTCRRTMPRTCFHQCPVYKDWCEYDVLDWVTRGELKTSSGKTLQVSRTLKAKGEKERIETHEQYDVAFTSAGHVWSFHPATEAEFQQFSPQSRWRLKLDREGKVVSVESGTASLPR